MGAANGNGGTRIAMVVILTVLLTGCGREYRGLPGHGGGKRFDEEQRVVSASIREAVAQMDLVELAGRRIAIQVENLATTGSGDLQHPGVTNVNLGGGIFPSTYRLDRENNSDGYHEGRVEGRGQTTLNVNIRANPEYRSANNNTERDVSYLEASVAMKARHDGVRVSTQNPDVILYVLVDVLGTNVSRNNRNAGHRDLMRATCEITYYAEDRETGALLFRARQVGANATYTEDHRSFGRLTIDRLVQSGREMDFAVSYSDPPTPADPANPEPDESLPPDEDQGAASAGADGDTGADADALAAESSP